MGSKTAITSLWLLLLGLTDGSIEVNMTGAWKPRVGWEMNCVWSLDGVPLQSVRLYLDDVQFHIFRPEIFGRNFSTKFAPLTGETRMKVHCHDLGSTGSCAIVVELLSAPIFDAIYKCEVCEEAPRFRMKEALYRQEVFVPPTNPQLKGRNLNETTEVNCTSAGLPAPRLRWTVGDNKIQETFSGRRWDFDSKLWHSWSVISILQPSELPLTCIATVDNAGRTSEALTSALYNSASHLRGVASLLGLTLMTLLR